MTAQKAKAGMTAVTGQDLHLHVAAALGIGKVLFDAAWVGQTGRGP